MPTNPSQGVGFLVWSFSHWKHPRKIIHSLLYCISCFKGHISKSFSVSLAGWEVTDDHQCPQRPSLCVWWPGSAIINLTAGCNKNVSMRVLCWREAVTICAGSITSHMWFILSVWLRASRHSLGPDCHYAVEVLEENITVSSHFPQATIAASPHVNFNVTQTASRLRDVSLETCNKGSEVKNLKFLQNCNFLFVERERFRDFRIWISAQFAFFWPDEKWLTGCVF